MTDSDVTARIERALARLRDPAHASLDRAVELSIEAALDLPLRTLVEPHRVVEQAVGVIDAAKIERALASLARPMYARQRAAFEASGDRLRLWLPEGAGQRLDDILDRSRAPSGAWARDVIDKAHVRELVAPVLQETLLAFAKRLPLVGASDDGRAGKLIGDLARGFVQGASERAAKLAELGRGVLGGLGAEMEKRVATAASEFSHGAFDPVREAWSQRLASPEGKAILAKMRAHAIETLLDARVSQLLDDLDAAPAAELDALVARTIEHALGRPETRALLEAELEQQLAEREGWTVRQWLDEWGLRAAVTDEARRSIEKVAREAARTEAFAEWLRDLLAD